MEPKIWEPTAVDSSIEQRRMLALAVVTLAFLFIVASGVAVYEYGRAQEQTQIAAAEHQRADAQASQVTILQRQLGASQRDIASLREKASTPAPISAIKRFFSGARNLFSR